MLKTNIPTLDRDFVSQLDKEQLVAIVLEQNQSMVTMRTQLSFFHDEILRLQSKVAALEKNSANSSKPPSSDMPGAGGANSTSHHRNSRQPSGRQSGGQPGHQGRTRQPVANPDTVIVCAPDACEGCGAALSGDTASDKIVARSQVVDIPPIVPVVTEYQAVARTCACGHVTNGHLPREAAAAGTVQIGSTAGSLLVYLNSAHHLPYQRLQQVAADLFNLPLSQGTIDNKLEVAGCAAALIAQTVLEYLQASPCVGSDETGVRVAGRRVWQWVWQNARASYYVISEHRDYRTVKASFGERFRGCLIHDCYSAQNNTAAGWHQLCHAHLLRDLQFVVDTEHSVWAYRLQGFLIRAQRARDHIWENGFDPDQREAVIDGYYRQLERLTSQTIAGKEASRLQKRFRKHEAKILYFMTTPDIPPDNNGSERAIRNAKVKQKVSGGYRSYRGAERQAMLLSVIETAKKQELNVLEVIQRLVRGETVQLFGAE